MQNLIKSQQVLLRDAGFYAGEISGVWNPACQDAMRAFTGTAKAYPARLRENHFSTCDTIPQSWRWVGAGAELRLVRRDRPDTNYSLPETTSPAPVEVTADSVSEDQLETEEASSSVLATPAVAAEVQEPEVTQAPVAQVKVKKR
jgi:hypothetical protein